MMNICKVLKLNSLERILLVNSLFLMCSVRLGLLVFPFPLVRKVLARTVGAASSTKKYPVLPMERIIWAIKTASRFVPDGNHCLTRAIVARILLSHYGYESTLRIGVFRGKSKKLQAHAWLENDGCILIGTLPNLSSYTPFPIDCGDLL